jgi:type II secretory pathway pseudopilin PulG
MASSRATCSHRSPEDGFTIIEVLMALVLLTGGVLAMIGTFDASKRANNSSERIEVAGHIAQSETEKILALPYASIGTTSAPANSGSGNAWDPLRYVVNGPPVAYAYDWSLPAVSEQVATGGTLAPSSAWSDGRLSGTIYRFVTWVADACPSCQNSQDYKRVTVVVTVNGAPARKPFIDSTVVAA